VLSDGHLVPDGPGIGVEPIPDVLASVITDRRWLPADAN
jgi:o-succinylbenzoate synthase